MAKTKENPKQKSPYPYHTLAACLKLGKVVADHGGDRIEVPKAVIADKLEADQGSSAFAMYVASAKTYGIVEGMTSLRLSPRGREYFFPTSESEARSAQLDFFVTPNAFRFLVDKFDGSRVPETLMIANVIGRERHVPDSWKLRVAQIFCSTASEIGVLDSNRYLRFASAVHAVGRNGSHPQVTTYAPNVIVESTGNITPENRTMSTVSMQTSQAAADMNVWTFSEGGGTVRLELSNPIPWELWDRLKRYVTVIEPSRSTTSKRKVGDEEK